MVTEIVQGGERINKKKGRDSREVVVDGQSE
jgi:hypothetical protein